MSRRFLLNDLTPATRALYRAYRDAVREQRRLGVLEEAAYQRKQVPATTLWHIERNPDAYDQGVREQIEAELVELSAQFERACQRWNVACAAAQEAFWAAVPAMEAEGYPRQWFNTPTGAVVIPAGLTSPGANRPGRTRKG